MKLTMSHLVLTAILLAGCSSSAATGSAEPASMCVGRRNLMTAAESRVSISNNGPTLAKMLLPQSAAIPVERWVNYHYVKPTVKQNIKALSILLKRRNFPSLF